MILKYVFIPLFLLSSWVTFKSYNQKSFLISQSVDSEKVLDLESRISKIEATIGSSSKGDRIIITDYEAKMAIRDISSMKETIKKISNSYTGFQKSHIINANQAFLYNLMISIVTALLAIVFYFVNQSNLTFNGLINSKEDNNEESDEIGVFASLDPSQIKNFLEEKDEDTTQLDQNLVTQESQETDLNIVGLELNKKHQFYLENFLNNKFINGPQKNYIIEDQTINDDKLIYSLKSENGERLDLNYELISHFLNELTVLCHESIPSIELSRDIHSMEINFSVTMSKLLDDQGDFSNAEAI